MSTSIPLPEGEPGVEIVEAVQMMNNFVYLRIRSSIINWVLLDEQTKEHWILYKYIKPNA